MKKYFNNSLFYQGDANIFQSLCIVYVATFLLILMTTNSYFSWEINNYIYNNMDVKFIFSFEETLLLIAYILIVYIITVGVFKRKKWSTFLSGPFSRVDIRARELIIIIFSIIIFIAIFLSVIVKNYIQYYDILIYIKGFYIIVILDIIRIISISTLAIGILSIADTIFANLYYLIGATIFSFVYSLFIILDFMPILSYSLYGEVYGPRYVYNGLMEYLSGGIIGYRNSVLQIICMSIAFIIIGMVLIYISKKLTSKMLVENMNEGIIFNFPKKVAKFMIVTFVGLASATYISGLINEIYFRNALGEYELVALRVAIIVVISIISYIALKNFKKSKKDVYY